MELMPKLLYGAKMNSRVLGERFSRCLRLVIAASLLNPIPYLPFFISPAVAAEFEVVDKFTVNGPSVFRSSATFSSSTTWTALGAQPVSQAARGTIYYNAAENKFKVSENAGAYFNLMGGYWSQASGLVSLSTITDRLVIGRSDLTEGMFLVSTNTTAMPSIYVSATTGNVGLGTTAPAAVLDVNGFAQFGSGITKSTITATGDWIGASGSSLTLSGANGFITSQSSVTASAFFGSGAALTGIPSTASIVGTYVAKAGDTMTGNLYAPHVTATTSMTVSGNAFSVGGSTFVVAGGNVGIGTTAPAATLHVSSAASSAATPLLVVSSGVLAGQQLMVVQAGGNVGIGTTNPGEKTEIAGNLYLNAAAPNLYMKTTVKAPVLFISGSADLNLGVAGGNGINSIFYNSGGLGAKFMSPSGAQMALITDPGVNVSTHFFVSAGSVGIGTTSPSRPLTISGPGNAGIGINTTGTGSGNTAQIAFGEQDVEKAYLTWWSQFGTMGLTSGAGTDGIHFNPTTGKVGIATVNPATTLEVNGNAQFGAGAAKSTFTTTGALTMAGNAALTLSGVSGNIVSGASITASSFYGYGGNLTGLPSSEINTYTSSKTFTSGVAITGGDLLVVSTAAVRGDAFSVGTSTLVVAGGRVGIGTTSPGAKFEVVGAGNGDGILVTGPSPVVAISSGGAINTLGVASSNGNFSSDALAGDMILRAGSTGVTTNLILQTGTGASAMYIQKGSNNIGVGTAGPSAKLHVSSGVVLIDGAGGALKIADGTQGSGKVLTSDVNGLASWSNAAGGDAILAATQTFSGANTFLSSFTVRSGGREIILSTSATAGVSSIFVSTLGNVGIGTTSPGAKLDVSGSLIISNADAAISAPSTIAGYTLTGYSVVVSAAKPWIVQRLGGSGEFSIENAAGTPVMQVQDDGNVGIGTQAPATKLDVNGTAQFGSGVDKSTFSTSGRLTLSNPGVVNDPGSIFLNMDSDTGGSDQVFQVAQGRDTYEGGTILFTVQQAGNVGISTATPTSKLHVHDGDIRISTTPDAASRGIYFQDGTLQTTASGSNSGWTKTGNLVSLTSGSDNVVIQSTLTVQGNAFSVGTSTLIVAGGRVGIGTTSPQAGLDVSFANLTLVLGSDDSANTRTNATQKIARAGSYPYTNANLKNAMFMAVNGVSNAELYLGGGSGAMNAATHLFFYTGANNNTLAGTERMRIDPTGYVGIGTTGPSANLHISSAASSATTPLMIISSGAAAGQELLRVQANGNVGIGTTSPGAALDIRGATDGVNMFVRNSAGNTANYTAYYDITGNQWNIGNYATSKLAIFQNGTAPGNSGIIFSGSNVGIGTAGPSAKLHVSSGVVLIDGAGGALKIADGTQGSGKVLTSDVNGLASWSNAAGGDAILAATQTFSGANTFLSSFTVRSGGREIILSTSATAGVASIFVSTEGRVGIGTTSPGDSSLSAEFSNPKVHLKDANTVMTQYVEGALGGQLVFIDSGGPADQKAISLYMGTASGDAQILRIRSWTDGIALKHNLLTLDGDTGSVGIATAAPIGLFTVGNGTMVVTAAGNVGIGTTNPVSPLHVRYGGVGSVITADSVNASPAIFTGRIIQADGVTAKNAVTISYDDNTNNRGILNISSNAATAISLNAGGNSFFNVGNVGMGTTGPTSPNSFARTLEVSGTSNASLVLSSVGGVGTSWELGSENTAGGLLGIFSGTSRVMSLSGTGNVGIGTAGPVGKLHVSSGVVLIDGAGGALKIVDGTQGAGKVLTSDGVGLASWSAAGAGDAVLAATQTFSGANTFTSSFTVRSGGREIILSTSATAGVASVFVSNTGNVGIGTTVPGNKLHVSDVNSANTAITRYESNASNLAYFGAIGTANTDFGALRQQRNMWWADGTGSLGIDIVANKSDADFRIYTGGNAAGYERLRITSSGNVGIASATPVGLFTVGNGTMVVTAAGYVGIGTTEPVRRLHVLAPIDTIPAILAIPTATTNLLLRSLELETKTSGVSADGFGTGIIFEISDSGASNQSLGSIGMVRAGAVNTGDIVFRPATAGAESEKVRITSAGKVGIGTTGPVGKLHVSSGVVIIDGAGGALKIVDGTQGAGKVLTSDGVGLASWSSAGAGDAVLAATQTFTGANTFGSSFTVRSGGREIVLSTSATAGVASIFVSTEGRVGIGTTSPGPKLHVLATESDTVGTTNAMLGLGIDSGIMPLFGFRISATGGEKLGLDYRGGGADYNSMTWDRAGKVGIGTQVPATKLEVNGDAQFGAGATKSTFTATGALGLAGDAALTLSGASGNITTGSSVTASAFFGSGAALTGIPSTASISGTYVAKAGDTMTGQLTNTSTITVQGSAFSVGGSTFVVAGGKIGFGTASIIDKFQFHTATDENLLVRAGSSIFGVGTIGIDTLNDSGSALAPLGIRGDSQTFMVRDNLIPLFLNTAGKVGVGTTVPVARLHVSSAGAIATDTIFIASSGTAAGQELFVVKGDGKVGIGTTNPGSKLSIDGPVAPAVSISSNGTIAAYFGVATNTNNYAQGAVAGDAIIRTQGGKLMFDTNSGSGTNAMTILGANGSVGIGTSGPGAKLDIQDTSVTDSYSLRVGTSATAYHVAVTTMGNVGIGTTAPLTKMDVAGTVRSTNYDTPITSGNGIQMAFVPSGARGDGWLWSGQWPSATGNGLMLVGSTVTVTTDNGAAITVLNNRNVGIGTSTPGTLLDVSGAIRGSSITLTGTGNDPYNLTTSSGIHILKGKLKLEQGAWIEWADGSSSSSTSSGGGGGSSVIASTFTVLSSDYSDATGLVYTCVAGSTITLTTGANYLDVRLANGALSNTATNMGAHVGILIDGKPPDGLSNGTMSAMVAQTGGTDNVVPANFAYRTTGAVSAGSHSVCLFFGRNGGSGTARLACGVWGPCTFSVSESIASTGGGGSVGSGGWSDNSTTVFVTTATKNVVIQSTLTVQGNAFSVGTSTLVVSGGNVGVGTTDPIRKLDIRIPARTTAYSDISNPTWADVIISNPTDTVGTATGIMFSVDDAGPDVANGPGIAAVKEETGYTSSLVFITDPSAAQSAERMRITAAGLVGVGTAVPATKLHMSSGTLTIDGNVANSINFTSYDQTITGRSNGTTNPSLNLANSGDGGVILNNSAGINLRVKSGPFAGVYITGDTRGPSFVGFTGIATSVAETTLDVNGNAQFGFGATKSTFTTTADLIMAAGSSITLSGANGFITTGSSITASAFFGYGGNLTGISAAEGNTYTSSKTFTSNAFSVGGSTLVVAGGLVGIGTTGPVAMLDVASGTVRATGFGAAPTSGAGTEVYYRSDLATGYVIAYDRGAGAAKDLNLGLNLIVKASGNVGIGTAGPATKLEVNGDAQFGAGATKSTFTATGALGLAGDAALTLSGASGHITTGSSVTASAFFGSGAALTGIPSTASISGTYVAKGGDTMTGTLTMNAATALTTGDRPSVYIATHVMVNGVVGVGTTAPGSSSVTGLSFSYESVLHMAGSARPSPTISGQGVDFRFVDTNGAADTKAADIVYDDQVFKFRGLTDAGGVKNDPTFLVNTNTGRVGVGTTFPGSKLHLSSGTFTMDGTNPYIIQYPDAGYAGGLQINYAQGATAGAQRIQANTAAGVPLSYLEFGYDTDATDKTKYTDISLWATQANSNMHFGTNSTERVTIKDSGSVGIGTTGSVATLHVSSAASAAAAPILIVSSGAAAGQELLWVQKDGNIGIGTTAPESNLTVSGAAAGTINLWGNRGGTWRDRYYLEASAADNFTIGQFLAGVATPALTIKDFSGNVGIGTSGPGAKLDIQDTSATDSYSLRVGTSAAAYHVAVTTMGNVGIGTTAPLTKMDVAGTVRSTNYDTPITSGNGIQMAFVPSGARGDGWLWSGQWPSATGNGLMLVGSTVTVTTDNGAAITVLNNRNVGIGTSTPGTLLDVSGAIRGSSITLTGTGNDPYNLTTSSGIHILKGKLKLEQGAWIEWADGSTSSSTSSGGGSGGGSSGVFIGTFTSNMASYTMTGTPNVCVPGSTITYTATGGAMTEFTVEGWQDSNGYPQMSILVDGVEFMGAGKRYQAQTTGTFNLVNTWFVAGPAAGTRSVCWALWYNSGNAGGLKGPAATYSNGFFVKEITSGGSGVAVGSGGWSDTSTTVFVTTATKNVVIQSTLTVQGSAFSVGTSTLVVTSGNIGIGTTSPSSKLHVASGTFLVNGYGGGATIGFSSASFSNDIALTLSRAGGPTTAGSRGVGLVFQDADNPSLLAGVVGIRTAPDGNYNGDLAFYTNTGGGAATTIAGMAQRMLIKNDGNVGIGTTLPNVGANTGKVLTLYHGGAGASYNSVFESVLDSQGSGKTTYAFYDEGASAGNTIAKMEVSGANNKTGNFNFLTSNTGGTLSSTLFLQTGGNVGISSANPVGLFTVGNGTMVVTAAGNVGIGTTGPATRLHMSSGVFTIDGTGAGLNVAGPSTATYFYGNGSGLTGISPGEGNTYTSSKTFTSGVGITGGDLLVVSTATVRGNAFSVGTSTLVVAGGNVGIGTTTPGAKLEIKDAQTTMNNASLIISRNATTDAQSIRFGVGAADNFAIGRQGSSDKFEMGQITGAGTFVSNMTIDPATGRVGVGTAVPAAALHISSNAGAAATPILIVSSGTGAVGQELFWVQKDGKVGIGTTGPAVALDVNGALLVRSAFPAHGASRAGMDYSPGGGRIWSWGVNDSTIGTLAIELRSSAGALGGTAGTFSTTGLNLTGTLTVASTGNSSIAGNVGIGTTSPAARLHISSDSAIASDTILLASSGAAAGQELMVIKGDGKVGIGTSGPATKLEVNGDAQFGSGAAKSTFTATGNLQMVSGSTITSNGTFSISTAASAALTGLPALFINQSGNVGLGTAIPTEKLSLFDPASAKIKLQTADLSATLENNYDRFQAIFGAANLTMQYTSGNVGIGATNPGTLLDVSGAMRGSSITLTGTGTDPYNLTTSSGIHILKGKLKLEQGAWIEWADGSTSSSTSSGGGSGSGGSVFASTESYPNGTATQSTLNACIANSTGTWTQGNNRALICFAGGVCGDGAVNAKAGILLDGAFLPGFDKDHGQASDTLGNTSGQFCGNMSFCVITPVLSAGAHSACFNLATGGATLTVPANLSAAQSSAKLSVIEIAGNTGGSVGSGGWSDNSTTVFVTTATKNVIIQSTLTVQGNAFSVGTSTLVVTGGNVGVGTTAPSALLHISSSATAGATSNLVLVTTGAANVFRVQANGNVYAQGAFHGGGADLAEMYRAEQEVEAGDVVAFTRDGVLTRAGLETGPAFGIVSSNPGMVLGQNIPDNDRPDYRPVALTGRVPVKATLENGRIRRGDHLSASSKPGYATRAKPGAAIIGMALEDFKEAEGTVLCFIKAGVNSTSEIESLRRDNERLSREISELRSLIEGR